MKLYEMILKVRELKTKQKLMDKLINNEDPVIAEYGRAQWDIAEDEIYGLYQDLRDWLGFDDEVDLELVDLYFKL